ncbi:MAG TPA: hypothetical protein VGH28_08160 [Polyangiaceae bacterium]|jgi:outer membrane biosynthesis protein TonB
MAAKKKKKKTPVAKKKPTAPKKPAPKKKKATPKAKAKTKAKPKAKAPKKKAVQRRDRPGHIDPKYAKQLRDQSTGGTKKDSRRGAFKVKNDDLAEELGGEVVGKATTGEDEGEDVANETFVEEVGGPFVVTTGGEEFADGTDESNPEDAEAEPFPRT